MVTTTFLKGVFVSFAKVFYGLVARELPTANALMGESRYTLPQRLVGDLISWGFVAKSLPNLAAKGCVVRGLGAFPKELLPFCLGYIGCSPQGGFSRNGEPATVR